MMLGNSGTGKIVKITQSNRTSVTSQSRYSANPAQTPPILTFVDERIKRLPVHGAAPVAGVGACLTPQK
jgi:hypothetical protein